MANRYALTERQKVMDTYLKGCVNLYGFVTIRQFLKVFNRYNQPRAIRGRFLDCPFHNLNFHEQADLAVTGRASSGVCVGLRAIRESPLR